MCVYIYIYIYICIEREGERDSILMYRECGSRLAAAPTFWRSRLRDEAKYTPSPPTESFPIKSP